MTIVRRVVQGVSWGAAGGLIGVFLIGYSAPFLPPVQFWWADLPAVFLPLMSIVVGGLALVWGGQGLRRGAWGRLVLAAVLLGLIIVRFGPRIGIGPSVSASNEALRVMTFNIPPSFRDRGAGEAAALVRREAPHILAVQESRLMTGRTAQDGPSEVSAPLLPLLNESPAYALPGARPSGVKIQQPVLGRLQLDSLSVHSLPPDGKESSRSRYTRIQFRWQGRPAVLYNLHLHTVGSPRPWTMIGELSLDRWSTFLQTYRKGALLRARQARRIREHIERESAPVLVVGDFNSTPHQWAYGHLAEGFRSVLARRGHGWGGTFPAYRPLVQIDHILVDSAWQVEQARVVGGTRERAPSDHRPVVAHLRWNDD